MQGLDTNDLLGLPKISFPGAESLCQTFLIKGRHISSILRASRSFCKGSLIFLTLNKHFVVGLAWIDTYRL